MPSGTLPGVFGGLPAGMSVAWICVISCEVRARLSPAT